jgi:hypothetical protein
MFIIENYSVAVIFALSPCYAGAPGPTPKSLPKKHGALNYFIGIM